jgi:ribonucleoside-diphosphate reductase alpha chain
MSDHLNERKDPMNDTNAVMDMASAQTQSSGYESKPVSFRVTKRDGALVPFDMDRLKRSVAWAQSGLEEETDTALLLNEAVQNSFDKITELEIADALIMSAVAFMERDPAYGYVAARLLFKKLFKTTTDVSVLNADVDHLYCAQFKKGLQQGVESEGFDPRLLEFDLDRLALSLVPERDHLLDYMGLRTLYERYFAQCEKQHIELPQTFWMRVAMGLAIEEQDKNEKAIEFYNIISQLQYVPSTPTLLHSGLTRAQLSSCFLATVTDDLHHIFKCIGDCAQMAKWSGGVAYDWTNIRACGSWVKSIKTESQGVIPYLKVANDTIASINRSGRRRGAGVVYLESWHLEVEDFVDLRRNTGDERRRTHDMNTANWVPDLFMKRMIAGGDWTLFSPDDVPDLHSLYGRAFEEKYEEYEQKARDGEISLHKVIKAKDLWKKMLTRLFETGHPWITFKDPCNVRSPQDHAGVVHSSNLCTEITLNTSKDETAVCNLGSINMARHIVKGEIDYNLLAKTVKTAARMLDNVIDINFYPTQEGKTSNLRHRPVGLGLMGFQDALYKLNVGFDDAKVVDIADEIMEFISYHAIATSSALAKERGTYSSYKGSKWDRNIFPVDTIDLLEKERGEKITLTKRTGKLDWTPVRDHVQQYGMRNSNVMAIAPTATISTIANCIPCIEPIYKNIYVKSNMTGEFTVVNRYLIEDLKQLGLWDQDMLDQIKYHDGNLTGVNRIPQQLRAKYKEVFQIDPHHLVQVTAARGKWIDQSQSHNVFMQGVSGKLLSDIYIAGWKAGLKTFYYLRTLGASQIEKSTLDAKKFGFTQKRTTTQTTEEQITPQACSIENEDCEACQ